MAIVVLNAGGKLTINHDQSIDIWRVLSGEMTPTPEQEVFCSKIKNIYLAWQEAPDSYIEQRLENIIYSAFGSWSCKSDGSIGRPEGEHAWRFAKRWGLWLNGAPTDKALRLWDTHVKLPRATLPSNTNW